MSQNTEQNMRTRHEQVANAVKFARLQPQATVEFLWCYLEPMLKEAEARGAAEERAKSAGRPVYQWRLTPDDNWVTAVDATELEQVRNGYPASETRTLYTHPANVAALEARVKEVEVEKKQAFNQGYLIACCNVANMHNEPSIACDVLAECGLTEDDVEEADLSEYDANALSEIRKARGDQDPICAALTREGGV